MGPSQLYIDSMPQAAGSEPSEMDGICYMPMEFTPNPNDALNASSAMSRGAESLAREVQNQVAGAAANSAVGVDKLASALPAPGADAALGLGAGPIPGGEQALSPLMNMIMKMPGHISFFSSMFEALGSFFMPQLDMLGALDPANLGLDSLFSPEHMGLDLSLLPDDAPFLSSLDGPTLNFGTGDLLSNKLNFSLGHTSSLNLSKEAMSTFRQNLNVSGNVLGKPQFEGTGVLSGPSMQEGTGHLSLSGNNRIFADGAGEPSSNFNNNIASQGPSNVAGGAGANANQLNVSGNTGANMGAAQNASGGLGDFRAFDGASQLNQNVGHNIFGGNKDLVAYNNDNSFQSTVSSPKADISQTNSAELGGMKAKALSLDGKNNFADLNKEVGKTADLHKEVGKDLGKDAAKETARTHRAFDRASHSLKPTHSASHTASHASAAPKVSAPKVSAPNKVEIAQAQPQDMQQMQAQDQGQVVGQDGQVAGQDGQVAGQDGQVPGQEVAAEAQPQTYTIKAGDNLWNIAKDQLGNATKWSDIYKMNEGVLGANPDLIRPGTTIQLPGVDQAQAGNIAAHYTVKPGDNLWDIAKNQLGDGTKWGELYKANEGVIGANPRLIQPGQELSLGGDPNGASMQLSANPGSQVAPTAATQPQVIGQSAMAPQAQAAPMQGQGSFEANPAIQGYGMEENATMQNFEAAPMTQQQALPNQSVVPAKVIPAQAQPDALIPPAHAADGSFTNFESSLGSSIGNISTPKANVNTNMGADMFSFLNKRK